MNLNMSLISFTLSAGRVGFTFSGFGTIIFQTGVSPTSVVFDFEHFLDFVCMKRKFTVIMFKSANEVLNDTSCKTWLNSSIDT